MAVGILALAFEYWVLSGMRRPRQHRRPNAPGRHNENDPEAASSTGPREGHTEQDVASIATTRPQPAHVKSTRS